VLLLVVCVPFGMGLFLVLMERLETLLFPVARVVEAGAAAALDALADPVSDAVAGLDGPDRAVATSAVPSGVQDLVRRPPAGRDGAVHVAVPVGGGLGAGPVHPAHGRPDRVPVPGQ
jgi:hypothetical protein